MLMKINNLFGQNKPLFSLEIFPPKTDAGYEKLKDTLQELSQLNPDFISCTYGAGGGNRDKTLEIVEYIQKECKIPALHHLTCVLHTKDELKEIIQEIANKGIQNILALRGDPPQDQPNWTPGPNNFAYSYKLCDFIKENFPNDFCLGVAGFPEGHIDTPTKELDIQYLKTKIDHGADFVMTQLFFDNTLYFDYVSRLKEIGVNSPVIPGILPITNYQSLINFCERCGATIPDQVHTIFQPIADDPKKVYEAGVQFCIDQCKELLDNGAPGIHFYALNKIEPVSTILKAVRQN